MGKASNSDIVGELRQDYEWQTSFFKFEEESHPLSKTMFPIAQQFYLGGMGTGAPIHYHGDAWNVCAYGARRWFLFAPQSSTYSKIPMKEWVEYDYPKLKKSERPMECMQRAGDVIFVPHMFGHGTYNVQESVGVAVEIQHCQQNPNGFIRDSM